MKTNLVIVSFLFALSGPLALAAQEINHQVIMPYDYMGKVVERDSGRMVDLFGEDGSFFGTYTLREDVDDPVNPSGSYLTYFSKDRGEVLLYKDGRIGFVNFPEDLDGELALKQGLFLIRKGGFDRQALSNLKSAAAIFQQQKNWDGYRRAQAEIQKLKLKGVQ
ncbi:hypothetical protein [Anthocerotibacter panamensis]|uniref:hypothetical protein n=1 Tax=Anthocerotibacter panamensis TaxID=2857077 RepID=UPI001C403F57|nr:hypothetical protein [Anthocerotibacter panamensis]